MRRSPRAGSRSTPRVVRPRTLRLSQRDHAGAQPVYVMMPRAMRGDDARAERQRPVPFQYWSASGECRGRHKNNEARTKPGPVGLVACLACATSDR